MKPAGRAIGAWTSTWQTEGWRTEGTPESGVRSSGARALGNARAERLLPYGSMRGVRVGLASSLCLLAGACAAIPELSYAEAGADEAGPSQDATIPEDTSADDAVASDGGDDPGDDASDGAPQVDACSDAAHTACLGPNAPPGAACCAG